MLNEEAVKQAAARFEIAPLSFVLSAVSAKGPHVEVDAGLPLYPASMIKTPLAAAVYALADRGELHLEDTVAVAEANMTANDVESPMVPGYRATLSELVDWMLTRSDNVATNVLFDVAGRERATGIVQRDFGLRSTAFRRKLSGALPLIHDPGWDGTNRNAHPAADAARLFEAIALDRVPFAAQLRETLLRQQWNGKLPAGLRPGDRFAHKTGDTDEVTHDGGILETESGERYVIVAYTGMESNDRNNEKFAPFMDLLRTFLR